MKPRIEYNFAKEYTEYPGPRYEKIGDFSGERFREDVLEEFYKKEQPIELDISDVQISFGPSFLSEAFGLFAKYHGLEIFNEYIQIKENSEKAKRFKEKMIEYVIREIENK